MDIESDRFAHVLWKAATSAFSLERWVAERKFGPHFVVAKTPIANIRLTAFFAGEAEVRLVDPIADSFSSPSPAQSRPDDVHD